MVQTSRYMVDSDPKKLIFDMERDHLLWCMLAPPYTRVQDPCILPGLWDDSTAKSGIAKPVPGKIEAIFLRTLNLPLICYRDAKVLNPVSHFSVAIPLVLRICSYYVIS
jgi:hypothetical protein